MDQWVPGVKKIAVLRANALGDFIFAQPAFAALRAAYPQAELVLLGKHWHVDYLAGRPSPLDRAVAVPPYRGVSEAENWVEPDAAGQVELERFFTRMQAESFDLALQMHGGGGNSNPFVQRLGARLTAGLRAAAAPALDRSIPYIYWQHEILRLLEVVGLVGAPPVTLEPRVSVTEDDLAEAETALPNSAQPLVVIHPGASDPRRRWPAERFAAVGDALARAGCQVVVVGIPAEQGTTTAVVNQMRAPAIDLSGALSLSGLTGLLSRAALVIANDSGPRHLAEAVGAPTVGIFWCGNLINAGPAFRARHRPHLSWRIHCPVCGRNTLHEPCQHSVSFVDEVSVAEVLQSALDLLHEPQPRPLPTQPAPRNPRTA